MLTLLLSLAMPVKDWLLIFTFVLNAYVVVAVPLLRKPVVVAGKATVHATEKVGRTATHPIRHPIKTVKKVVKEIE